MFRKLRLGGSAILLVLATSPNLWADPSSIDDGWRRTAQGWELLPTSPLLAVAHASPQPLWFHPILLAALQVSVVAAAYWRFPVQQQILNRDPICRAEELQ